MLLLAGAQRSRAASRLQHQNRRAAAGWPVRGQRRGARSVRRASALAHDACRKSKRRGTGWAPQRKAGVCRSTRGRLLLSSTPGPSRGRAKLTRPGRSRLSFARARRCFPGGPCAYGFRDFRSEVTFLGTFCARARRGRGLEGVKRQVGEGRLRRGLRSAEDTRLKGICPTDQSRCLLPLHQMKKIACRPVF